MNKSKGKVDVTPQVHTKLSPITLESMISEPGKRIVKAFVAIPIELNPQDLLEVFRYALSTFIERSTYDTQDKSIHKYLNAITEVEVKAVMSEAYLQTPSIRLEVGDEGGAEVYLYHEDKPEEEED